MVKKRVDLTIDFFVEQKNMRIGLPRFSRVIRLSGRIFAGQIQTESFPGLLL